MREEKSLTEDRAELPAAGFSLTRLAPRVDFGIFVADLKKSPQRILVLGMGGGCDIFAAYALARQLAQIHAASTVLYGNCVGRREMVGCVKVSDFLWSTPEKVVPLKPGDQAYGSVRLELSCPRGPEGSPLLFVVPGRRGEIERITAENLAAVVPALGAVSPDLIVGVDCGGDSVTGGIDWRGSPEAGRDMQVLRCFRESGVPFVHAVLGPGCDGESEEAAMLSSCQRLAAEGCLRGVFDVQALLADMAGCCRTLKGTRTPNLMQRAANGDLPEAKHPSGSKAYVRIDRGGRGTLVPREWLTVGLALVYSDGDESHQSRRKGKAQDRRPQQGQGRGETHK